MSKSLSKKKKQKKIKKSVWFPNLGFIDPGVLLAYIIILILSTKEFRKEKTSWLKISKFSATAFFGGLFLTIERG